MVYERASCEARDGYLSRAAALLSKTPVAIPGAQASFSAIAWLGGLRAARRVADSRADDDWRFEW